jgi:hypothetical protein
MTSRWALNFLAGPLTRTQIPALNKLAGKEKSDAPAGQASSKSSSTIPKAATAVEVVNNRGEVPSARPAGPGGVDEYFLQGEGGGLGMVYQPGLILQAQVRYFSKQYGVNQILRKTALIKELPQGMPDWKSYETGEMNPTRLLRAPVEGVKFLPLPAWLATRKKIDELRKDFSDWIYRQGSITVYTNEALKLTSNPGETWDAFLSRCKEAAARQGSVADAKQKNEFERKSLPLRQRIRDQQLKIQKLESQANSRQLEMVAKGGEVLLGLFGGRKRSISSGVTKYRMAEQAVANLKDAKQDLVSLEEQLRLLEQSFQANNVTGAEIATLINEVPISPQQKDIYMEFTGIFWELQS